MKKIELNEKAKKIIAWIMLVIMGIFAAIGISTCINGIYSCATKNKAEVRQVYAAEEQYTTFNTIPLTFIDDTEIYLTQNGNIAISFTDQQINITAYNNSQKGTTNAPYINYEIINSKGYYTLNNIEFTRTYGQDTETEYIDGIQLRINSTENIKLYHNYATTTFIPTYGVQYAQNGQIFIAFSNGEKGIEFAVIYDTQGGIYSQNYEEVRLNGSSNESLRESYVKGYNKGISDKEQYGQTQYTNGYNKGIQDANNYSFTGLISAVFDVPIQTIFGMLNFEILGVNILTIVTSILSIALLIFVLKMIFG